MGARFTPRAGAALAVTSLGVLSGWMFDLRVLTSLGEGWRVTVPASAFTLTCLGVALWLQSSPPTARVSHLLSFQVAVLGLVLPAATVVEYVLGLRWGVEHWIGIPFADTSDVAGRMSPMTACALLALGYGAAASAMAGHVRSTFAAVPAGTALMTAWLATLFVTFDPARLADTPRFPGMAAPTILLIALGSYAVVDRQVARDGGAVRVRTWRGALLAAFVLPIAAGWARAAIESSGRLDSSVPTAIASLVFCGGIAVLAWRTAKRVWRLEREQERAIEALERRVTERTEALAAANRELADANRRKDEFLATVAHELRNPLAPIRNAVHLLEHGAEASSTARSPLPIIRRQVEHMVRLIDDLLDVSRITTGRFRLQRERVRLDAVIARAVEMTQPHFLRSGQRLDVTLGGDAIWLTGDTARLTQVFANLLHNASKYAGSPGLVEVRAATTAGHVDVSVRDYGEGIPATFLPHVFEAFAQGSQHGRATDDGLGLGLSLVRGIVHLHGGMAWAESDGVAGHGSTFTVRLPLDADGSGRLPDRGEHRRALATVNDGAARE